MGQNLTWKQFTKPKPFLSLLFSSPMLMVLYPFSKNSVKKKLDKHQRTPVTPAQKLMAHSPLISQQDWKMRPQRSRKTGARQGALSMATRVLTTSLCRWVSDHQKRHVLVQNHLFANGSPCVHRCLSGLFIFTYPFYSCQQTGEKENRIEGKSEDNSKSQSCYYKSSKIKQFESSTISICFGIINLKEDLIIDVIATL